MTNILFNGISESNMPNSQFINLNINQQRYVNKKHSFSRIRDLIEIGGSSDVLVEMGKLMRVRGIIYECTTHLA